MGLETPQRGRASPFLTSFDTTDTAVRLLRDLDRNGHGRGVGPPPVQDLRPVRVYVQNNSGADKDALDVLALSGIVNSIEDADSGALTWIRQPTFSGTTPAATTDAFCILEEPAQYVAGGESPLAKGVIFGVVPVDVNVTDEAHDYATPTTGDATKLTSAESGPARILYKPSGTGTKRCVVRLDESAAGAVSSDESFMTTTNYSITANNTWEDTTLEFNLPSAGTYMMYGTVSAHARVSATPPGHIRVRLWDITNGDAIPSGSSSIGVVMAQVTGLDIIQTVGFMHRHTATGSADVRLEALRDAGPTWVTSNIIGTGGSGSYLTRAGYIKIG